MAQSGIQAVPSLPMSWDISIVTGSATGAINAGDWVCYSGQYVRAQFSGSDPGTAYWKTSGAGVALESNPMYDSWGNIVTASALKILTQGVILVSAAFSGQPGNGVGAYPVTTGSGVAAPTGRTGLGATWQTAEVFWSSALSGTAHAQAAAVGTVIGSQNFSNAGTGEMFVRLMPLAPDVRG